MATFTHCAATGKRRHPSLAAAHIVIHRLAGKRRVDLRLGALEAYWCRHCRGFHVGHGTEREAATEA
jgi:hypothetical protein